MSGDGYLWEEGPSSFQPNDSMLKAAVSSTSHNAESQCMTMVVACLAKTMLHFLCACSLLLMLRFFKRKCSAGGCGH